MSPDEVGEYARQQYNSVGDTFFSDSELYRHLYLGQMELAMKTHCIRRVYTAPTVIGTQEYPQPDNTISIKRITYDGRKLEKVTMREDDTLTLSNQATTATGTPSYYYEWGSSIFLRAVPDAVGTLKIFSFDKPQTVSASSTLDVPERYHVGLADYLLWKKALKDKNVQLAREYQSAWNETVTAATKYERIRLRGDSFVGVQDIDFIPQTMIGAI